MNEQKDGPVLLTAELATYCYQAIRCQDLDDDYYIELHALKAIADGRAVVIPADMLAELRRDAERYRWLRERHDACAAFCSFNPSDDFLDDDDWFHVDQSDGAGLILDSTIDAAIKQEKGE